MSPNTSLVPPRRLGMLLRDARVAAGWELAALIEGTSLSVVELDDIEHGRRRVDEATLETLVRIYGIEDAGLVPERSRLVIDLDEGRIAVDRADLAVDPADGPDAVLARYLALVYRLRDLPVGATLHFREVDIDVLATALALDGADIAGRLERLVRDESQVERDQQRIRRQLVLPLVGVVVAATTVGTIVLVVDDDPAPDDPPAVASDIGIGGAIEENPGG